VQYMLLIHSEEDGRPSDDVLQEKYAQYAKFTEDLRGSGAMVGGNELEPATTAKSIRVRDGKTLVTDGPFAETKETLGGYYLIEAGSEQEALDWAARIPGAQWGTIEVRPVVSR
jgi:hypothetical protein